jgi:hypothetical protein
MPMSDRTDRLGDAGDEEIARVREVRREISKRFGHDPYRLVAHYEELQETHPERILRAPERYPSFG